VKELHFASHFHRQLRTRCPIDYEVEADDDENEMDDESAETPYDNDTGSNLAWPSQPVHREFFDALESRLIPLFSHITDNSLENFRSVILLRLKLILTLT
jgi:hypothetical protein